MEINDKVKVIKQIHSPKNYPFLPNLIGQVGKISRIIKVEDDQDVIGIEFERPFKVGIIPDGGTAFGYQPTKWEERKYFSFTEEELVKVK